MTPNSSRPPAVVVSIASVSETNPIPRSPELGHRATRCASERPSWSRHQTPDASPGRGLRQQLVEPRRGGGIDEHPGRSRSWSCPELSGNSTTRTHRRTAVLARVLHVPGGRVALASLTSEKRWFLGHRVLAASGLSIDRHRVLMPPRAGCRRHEIAICMSTINGNQRGW